MSYCGSKYYNIWVHRFFLPSVIIYAFFHCYTLMVCLLCIIRNGVWYFFLCAYRAMLMECNRDVNCPAKPPNGIYKDTYAILFYPIHKAKNTLWNNSQVCRKLDMGRFHDVTTSTIDRGNSILSGLDTVISLQDQRWKRRLLTKRSERKHTFDVHGWLFFTDHFRFSFSSVKPAPARVVVVSLK